MSISTCSGRKVLRETRRPYFQTSYSIHPVDAPLWNAEIATEWGTSWHNWETRLEGYSVQYATPEARYGQRSQWGEDIGSDLLECPNKMKKVVPWSDQLCVK